MPSRSRSARPVRRHASSQQVKLAVDNCIFTVLDEALQVLLIQMKKRPFTGQWALPGGLVDDEETLDAAAARILSEQTGLSGVYLEQLYTFGELERDPLGRVVSVAYFSLTPPTATELRTTPKYTAVGWWPVGATPELAYDHGSILDYARQRLAWKLQYTNVVWSLLPRTFTLSELQRTYEVVLGRPLDKRNFRKKVLSLGLIQSVGAAVTGAHRPAMLYRFKRRRKELADML